MVREEQVIFTRTRPNMKCSSRFLVLGNCPNVLMSWLGAYLHENHHPSSGFICAWRLDPDEKTVWIFKTVEHAQMAMDRFHNPNKVLPGFVSHDLRLDKTLVCYQIHGNPCSMSRV